MTASGATDLVVFCPSSFGGIADYAHHQAEALSRSGCSVCMLCPEDYPHSPESYRQDRCLPGRGDRPRSKILRIWRLCSDWLGAYAILARKVCELGAKRVLLASYAEYLAPLWAWRLRRLRAGGVCFGAVVHDPVRDFVLGPLWWHRWSVSEGYSFLDHAFVHEPIVLDTGSRPDPVQTAVISHGPYPFPDAVQSRETTRDSLEIPQEAPLFLSFGHLRDGKNLKLILEAMSRVPEAWLLVAGPEAGTGHVKSGEYQEIAERLGVAGRCRWRIGFASPEDVASYFDAANHVLLTYEARFRSASGVLNLAVCYRRPVVASSGESNLASAVRRYQLGSWVEPDQAGQIARGMRELLDESVSPEWERYEKENSWERNAKQVIEAYDSLSTSLRLPG